MGGTPNIYNKSDIWLKKSGGTSLVRVTPCERKDPCDPIPDRKPVLGVIFKESGNFVPWVKLRANQWLTWAYYIPLTVMDRAEAVEEMESIFEEDEDE